MQKKFIRNSAVIVAGLIALGISLLIGCSKTPTTNESVFGTYDTKAMLSNVGKNILQSNVNNFTSGTDALVTAVQAFTGAPSDATLSAAQSAWETVSLQWAAVAPMAFGPVDNLTEQKIDYWPTYTNTIETNVANNADAATQGVNSTGIKALEYLLYDALGNNAVLVKYTSSSTAANRKSYLLGTARLLQAQATALKGGFSDTYVNSFVSQSGNDVASSVGLTVNALAIYIDVVKNMKIGNPIGWGVKINDNLPHTDQVEDNISNISLEVMKANVQSMKNVFTGGNGQGLDDLLDHQNAVSGSAKLSTVINTAFDDAIAKINAIPEPFTGSLSSHRKSAEEAYNSLKALLKYIKVDMANNLGVSITFTDTDGD